MTRSKLLGALLLVVGLLAGGLVVDYARAQSWPNFFDEDLFLDPDRYVVIPDGTPYTVPAGQVLLVGGVTSDYYYNEVQVNGQALAAFGYTSSDLGPGFVAREGDVVSVVAPYARAFAYGKLYRPLK